MKKLLFFATVALFFASCGSSSTEEVVATDSTMVEQTAPEAAVEAAPADSTAEVVAE